MANKIIHKHSSAIIDGKAKLPSKDIIEYGELAVNFKKDYETISLKNSEDEIVEFKSTNYIENIIIENEEITATALTDLDERVTAVDKVISENNEVISASLNDLNERIIILDADLSNKSDVNHTHEGVYATYDDFDTLNTKIDTNTENINEKLDNDIFANHLTDLDGRFEQISGEIETSRNDVIAIIEENEEITATALTDLDERVTAVDGKIDETNSRIKEVGGYIYIENLDKENFQNALTLALTSLNDDESAIIDCTYFKGKHNITEGFNINNPVTLIFGDIDIIYNNVNNTNLFTINSANVSIQGLNRNPDKSQVESGSSIFRMTNPDNSLEGYHIKSKGYKNIEIKNLTIVGLKTTMGHQYNNSTYDIDGVGGIYIEKEKPELTEGGNTCNNIRIENILIAGSKAHGIYIDTPILSSIKNVRLSECGGHGIFINAGTSILFENVYVSSSNMAGFCIFGSSYVSLNNCVAENGSIGFWVRSSFNVTLTSPGVESTKNQGANPWRNSQPITGVYGLNLSTTASNGSSLLIPDVNSDASGYFRGYGIIVSGGKSINIFTPYIKSISQATTNAGYPNGTEFSNNVKYINIIGDARAVFVLNPSFKETNTTVSSSIKHEIGVDSQVTNLELIYNTEQTTLTGTLDNVNYVTESSKRAPILLKSQTSVIRNGRNLINNYTADAPKSNLELANKQYVDNHNHDLDSLNGFTEFSTYVETKISKPTSTVGSATQPVYITSAGTISPCTAYSEASVSSATYATYIQLTQKTDSNYYPMVFATDLGNANCGLCTDSTGFAYNPSANTLLVSGGSISATNVYSEVLYQNGEKTDNIYAPLTKIYKYNQSTSTVPINIEPDNYYTFTGSSVNSLTLNLIDTYPIDKKVLIYNVEFIPRSIDFSLTLPSFIKWVNGVAPTSFTVGDSYQLSIVNNLAVIAHFPV